jgi:hypothetical protein
MVITPIWVWGLWAGEAEFGDLRGVLEAAVDWGLVVLGPWPLWWQALVFFLGSFIFVGVLALSVVLIGGGAEGHVPIFVLFLRGGEGLCRESRGRPGYIW